MTLINEYTFSYGRLDQRCCAATMDKPLMDFSRTPPLQKSVLSMAK